MSSIPLSDPSLDMDKFKYEQPTLHAVHAQLLTPSPSHSSGSASPEPPEIIPDAEDATVQKKKKKKRSKKSAKAKGASVEHGHNETRPPPLCISRNKHWRYISSYHGPWLQLPVELLDSLLILNIDPATLAAIDTPFRSLPSPPRSTTPSVRSRDRGFASLGNYSPPDSPQDPFASLPLPPPIPRPPPGKAIPPPVDPGVFRSVTAIRRLIDEASELSVRASSGLSAATLNSMRGGAGYGYGAFSAAAALGLNPLGDAANGRNALMSPTRIHRLRALAVQKLATAYKIDEIASSVMVMQGGTVFDDLAERVLKNDPNDADARYVHFFHEKIPSRQLAESTPTNVLDELIAAQPNQLEYYRTRGIVHIFRDEYAQATKDFTHALKESRARRRAQMDHCNGSPHSEQRSQSTKKKKGKRGTAGKKCHALEDRDALDDQPTIPGPDGEPLLLHPSVLEDAPDPLETQCLFLRASAYLQNAVFLIEDAILRLENVRKAPTPDGAEMRLSYIENGQYGGVETHPDGPLGARDGIKLHAYRAVLAAPAFREQVLYLVRRSLRDHEKFLAHFDSLDSPDAAFDGDLAARTAHAFMLSEALRPGIHEALPAATAPATFTTYHPLLVESRYTMLICHVLLGEFAGLLPAFERTAQVVDGLEGYPVFLPPRSMAQAEFVEILERLASAWSNGIQPHSLATAADKRSGNAGKRAVLAGPPSPPQSPVMDKPVDPLGPSTSGKSGAPCPAADDHDGLRQSLDCARMLLAPVKQRQLERTREKAERDKGKQTRPAPINIPLHGPRVDVVLAWMGAVHLPELDEVA